MKKGGKPGAACLIFSCRRRLRQRVEWKRIDVKRERERESWSRCLRHFRRDILGCPNRGFLSCPLPFMGSGLIAPHPRVNHPPRNLPLAYVHCRNAVDWRGHPRTWEAAHRPRRFPGPRVP